LILPALVAGITKDQTFFVVTSGAAENQETLNFLPTAKDSDAFAKLSWEAPSGSPCAARIKGLACQVDGNNQTICSASPNNVTNVAFTEQLRLVNSNQRMVLETAEGKVVLKQDDTSDLILHTAPAIFSEHQGARACNWHAEAGATSPPQGGVRLARS
jgi:hypothetical protein